MNPDGILTYQANVGLPLPVYASALVGLAGAGLIPHGLALSPADLGIAGFDMVDLDTLRSIDALGEYDKQLRARAQEIDNEYVGLPLPDAEKAEMTAIGQALVAIAERTDELTARRSFIEQISAKPENAVSGGFEMPNVIKKAGIENVFDLAAYRQRARSLDDLPQAYRDGAMRVIEASSFPTVADKAKAQGQVERLLHLPDDEDGVVARRVIGTGSPTYAKAFGEYVKHGYGAMAPSMQAALQTYTDADGGFAIPFTIDPTFILTSDGAVNPLRQIADVETITTKAWQGVTTAGVVASYAAETAAANDGAPTDVDGPKVTPVRAHVFIPFTAEYAEDYGQSLQAQLGSLVQDAKDVLEADKFVQGTGTAEPEGIVWKLDDDGTSLVLTITDNVYALDDIDKLESALGARFRAKASFLANRAIYQKTRGFGTAGQPANSIYDAMSKTLRGYAAYESTAMDDVTTDAKEILLLGDFKRFKIVDRIGLAIEYIPQVFDGNGKPLGQRGLYARWRNSSKVLVVNAFRLLKIQ